MFMNTIINHVRRNLYNSSTMCSLIFTAATMLKSLANIHEKIEHFIRHNTEKYASYI
jgi:hypothetical protein